MLFKQINVTVQLLSYTARYYFSIRHGPRWAADSHCFHLQIVACWLTTALSTLRRKSCERIYSERFYLRRVASDAKNHLTLAQFPRSRQDCILYLDERGKLEAV